MRVQENRQSVKRSFRSIHHDKDDDDDDDADDRQDAKHAKYDGPKYCQLLSLPSAPTNLPNAKAALVQDWPRLSITFLDAKGQVVRKTPIDYRPQMYMALASMEAIALSFELESSSSSSSSLPAVVSSYERRSKEILEKMPAKLDHLSISSATFIRTFPSEMDCLSLCAMVHSSSSQSFTSPISSLPTASSLLHVFSYDERSSTFRGPKLFMFGSNDMIPTRIVERDRQLWMYAPNELPSYASMSREGPIHSESYKHLSRVNVPRESGSVIDMIVSAGHMRMLLLCSNAVYVHGAHNEITELLAGHPTVSGHVDGPGHLARFDSATALVFLPHCVNNEQFIVLESTRIRHVYWLNPLTCFVCTLHVFDTTVPPPLHCLSVNCDSLMVVDENMNVSVLAIKQEREMVVRPPLSAFETHPKLSEAYVSVVNRIHKQCATQTSMPIGKDQTASVATLEHVMKDGDPAARLAFARRLLAVDQTNPDAIKLLTLAAGKPPFGSTTKCPRLQASFELGVQHMIGRACPQDVPLGVELVTTAHYAGLWQANHLTSIMLASGSIPQRPRNMEAALDAAKNAAIRSDRHPETVHTLTEIENVMKRGNARPSNFDPKLALDAGYSTMVLEALGNAPQEPGIAALLEQLAETYHHLTSARKLAEAFDGTYRTMRGIEPKSDPSRTVYWMMRARTIESYLRHPSAIADYMTGGPYDLEHVFMPKAPEEPGVSTDKTSKSEKKASKSSKSDKSDATSAMKQKSETDAREVPGTVVLPNGRIGCSVDGCGYVTDADTPGLRTRIRTHYYESKKAQKSGHETRGQANDE